MLFCLFLVCKFQLGRNTTFATPSTYPTICLAFFVFSWRVHLDLQTLMCLFLFHWLFLLIAYLVLPLFLPRPQIKQLGTLASLPNYWSAKIKQFGQTSFSILQQKLKHGMIQIRLLDHPSNVINMKACTHLALSWKYGIFVSAKQSIFGI